MKKVSENLAAIKEKLNQAATRVGRDPGTVTLIAVTKYSTIERAEEAIAAGVTSLGENYEKGMLEKKQVISDKAAWHFIGSLQSKKVKNIINEIDFLHSLDRESLAKEIQKRANRQVSCFVEVNTSGEATKHGLSMGEVIPFIQSIANYDKVHIVGLMTMATNTEDEAEIRQCFSNLKRMQGEVQALKLTYAPCEQLSMGMSGDYEIAVEEGATMIRIGTALVGE